MEALEVARSLVLAGDVRKAVLRCGFEVAGEEPGRIAARFLDRAVGLDCETLKIEEGELPEHLLAILMYHLATSDGSVPTGRWIAFTELPDGAFYVSAWRGYTTALIERAAPDAQVVRETLSVLPCRPMGLPGDVSCVFDVFPKLPVAFVFWEADEEFGARADFLFDETAGRHLPTDCVAICCSWLTRLVLGGQHG
ncbi:MAG: DUF3786 domain-containing protein [Coriobacteriia bacterium]